MDQNNDSSGFDQIQTPRYPVIHSPSQEMSKEFFQAKGDLKKSIQIFLEKFNCIPFGEKPKILLQAWEKFFSFQHAQPEDSNELFQKLLEDLQLQKKNMKDAMLELIEVYRQKEFYCMHNDVDDLIDSALNSKLLSINLNSQRLDKKKQEVKNISDEVTKSSVKNLVAILSEYEVTFDDESECDVLVKDDSSPTFTTFSNPLFDDNDDFTFSDDESLPEEDVPIENFKEEIRLVENLLNDISSPRLPKELNSEIAGTIVKSLSPSPIPVKDELLVDDSIPLPENESSNFDHHDNLSFPRPPPEPPDVEFLFNLEPELISAVMNYIDELNEEECFDPGGEIDTFANVEDDDCFPFIFVIRIFLPYLIYPEVSPLLFSVESEDTIFDPGISV
nr:hypothetical protein [Tanacetum cinerariifolium]